MVIATDPTDFLGYSRTQYYRRIELLTKAELIQPQRGLRNKILLSERDQRVLRQFRTIEQNCEELTMEGRLLALKASLLEEDRDSLKTQVDYLRAENRGLRTALVKYRRWTLRRVLSRVKAFFRRRSREPN